MAKRSLLGPLIRSLLGLLWFSAWFFVIFPAAILRLASGSGWPSLPAPGLPRSLGVAVAIIALGLLFLEALRFILRGRGTLLPFEATRALVVEGPYRFVRNPMYWLYVLVALGEALAFRSLALSVYALALFGLAHLYVVFREEPLLVTRFGESYQDYCQRVPRWLPRRTLPLEVRASDATARNSRGTL